MRMNPSELLDEIEDAGGQLEVLPDRGLRCHGVPAHLRDELVRLQSVVVAILLGECESHPVVPMDKKKLKKLIQTIEAHGGSFRLTSHAPGRMPFFECELADEDVGLTNVVIDHAGAIFEILWPEKKSHSKKRAKCEICRSGSGCRRTGVYELPVCQACGHACRSHFVSVHGFPGGCYRWTQLDSDPAHKQACSCAGFEEISTSSPVDKTLKMAEPAAADAAPTKSISMVAQALRERFLAGR
jgi:ribosomal protein L32